MFFREEDRDKLNYCHECAVADELSIQSINTAVKAMEQDLIEMKRNINSIKEILEDYAYLMQTRRDTAKKEKPTTRKPRVKKNVLPN